MDCDIDRAPFSIRSNIATHEETSSIAELSFEVSISPNPVQNVINISSEESVLATLYSLTGRKLLREHLGSGLNKIDVTTLDEGYYILHLTKDEKQLVTRLVKQ